MIQEQIPDLDSLIDYASGTCTPAERARIDVWLADSPEHRALLADAEVVWNSVRDRGIPQGNAVKIRGTIAAHIIQSRKAVSRRPRIASLGALAAGAFVFGVAVWIGPNFFERSKNSSSARTYTTLAGQRASLKLADGSQVTLGPGTTLRVRNERSTNSVAVEINGEALFSVDHSASHPFSVTAHGITTRVLGTEFIVRAYDPSFVRVAVRDGRVSVQSPVLTTSNSAVVAAGEAVSITPNTLPVITKINDLASDFSWANGELTLVDIPLGEALVRLSRWYGMEFKVSDPSFLNDKVNGTFPSTFSTSRINSLANIVGMHVTRSRSVITISK